MKYRLLNVIEFNSTRKRMTVIVRDEQDRVRVMCKGADSIIIPRLRAGTPHVDQTV
jgi:magnesium-transporting ATPase (P-type)